MELIVWVNLLVSCLLLFSFAYFAIRMAKWQLGFQGKVETVIALGTVTTPEENQRKLAFFGPQQGDVLPEFEVLEMNSEKTRSIQMSEGKETLIFITLVGCKACEDTLAKLESYNFKDFPFDIIVLTYIHPAVLHPEEKFLHHKNLVNALELQHKYIIMEPGIKMLEISGFPALIKVDTHGVVNGTYLAEAEFIDAHLEVLPLKKVS
ncbi:hypothetical protein BVG16_03015 [Paenibacillus selenitireducens]|uniref:Thioredoxin domain-containing protein n=1 Tax=Paenibacillus selenitireducens TaxID=1324314 RepID=A0A1T2XNP5_9BACL|nr:hypothetical protein [Paenibacillus selenitireducens]OPA81303.1 hypothetical protein BVG16_03015 [Paenibacillus selenitireducens]